MNMKRLIMATLGAFVAVFIFEMLWHGFLMRGMYNDTISVWRPESDSNMAIMLLSQFLFAAVLVYIYALVGKHLACKKGIAFGFFAGLLLAMPQLASYSYLPIPLTISLMWMAASVGKCVCAGYVTALIYKDSQATSEQP